MYGRKYMGTFRTTFIINEEGIIERIISPKEVRPKIMPHKSYSNLWQKNDELEFEGGIENAPKPNNSES